MEVQEEDFGAVNELKALTNLLVFPISTQEEC